MADSKKKKNISTSIVFVIFLVIAAVIVVYEIGSKDKSEPKESLTLFEEVTERDLSKDYPQTPAEVADVYCSIVKCMYTSDLTEEQLFTLCGQMRALYSKDLLEANSVNDMLYRLIEEIDEYKEDDVAISSYVVEPAEDVEYAVVGGKKRANVEFHFTIKGGGTSRIKEELMLEEDDDREYKIVGWRINEK